MAVLAVVLFVTAALWTAGVGGEAAAVVERTFVVSQMRMRHVCVDTPVTVVNGQFPGPMLEVTEGDSVAVHVINKSPHEITIHWHGVKMRMNCWNDGAGMITQCPIQPNSSYTYRFNVSEQEGTLWWHAHVNCLRGTIHGALVIRSRGGRNAYPFPKPDKEIPIIIGEWWKIDLARLGRNMLSNNFDDYPVSATINGKMGDLYNCSGVVEENYIMNVEHGKTYLLRIVNAALFSEYYFKIAGHKFMVVAADANYVKPYITDTIAIASGETVDALVVADATPRSYYMVALSSQPPKPDTQIPVFISRGIMQYNPRTVEAQSSTTPMAPKMPDQHDRITSLHFHGNLTSLLPLPNRNQRLPLPMHVDERMFITLGIGSFCRSGSRATYCDEVLIATMNNISFQLPTKTSLLEAHYHGKMSSVASLKEFPNMPPFPYNYTDESLIPFGKKEERIAPTTMGTSVKRFRFNTSVEIVFQSTGLLQSDSNPMHLHGHDFFVLAQGLGNFDPARDVKRYNLVDPPVRNTVLVPGLGWAAIRFVTDNPGVWYIHCHYEFHIAMGMVATFEVENGPTSDTTLPPPPTDLPKCDRRNNYVAYE